MALLVASSADVHKLLSMENCIKLMKVAFKSLAEGKVELPLRSIMRIPPAKKNLLGLMPCGVELEGGKVVFGIKVLSLYFTNHGTDFDSHQGGVLLFDGDFGQPIAMVDASSVTKIRTAAASGLATSYLAISDQPKPLVCGIIGAGVQAESHIEAMVAVRKLSKILIWNRTHSKAVALAKATTEKFKIATEALESLKDVVSSSDIICTVTAATEPIINSQWLKPGVHINAVGACIPRFRELDSATVKRALLFTDRRESLLAEAGDFLFPKNEGLIDDSHVKGELSDLVVGKSKGRESVTDITIFKSLGIAVEDIVCAYEIYLKAKEHQEGKWVDWSKL